MTLLVSGSRDTTIKIWDLTSGTLLNTLIGHSGAVWSVILSSDDSKIISGSYDKTIKIWDVKSGTLLNTLIGHSNYLGSVILTSDDSKIISGSYDTTIKIWDVKSGTLLNTLTGHSSAVDSVILQKANIRTAGKGGDNASVSSLLGFGRIVMILGGCVVLATILYLYRRVLKRRTNRTSYASLNLQELSEHSTDDEEDREHGETDPNERIPVLNRRGSRQNKKAK